MWPSQNQNPPPSACWGAYPAERLIGYSAALAPYIPTRNEQSWGFFQIATLGEKCCWPVDFGRVPGDPRRWQFSVLNAAGRGGLLTRSSLIGSPDDQDDEDDEPQGNPGSMRMIRMMRMMSPQEAPGSMRMSRMMKMRSAQEAQEA